MIHALIQTASKLPPHRARALLGTALQARVAGPPLETLIAEVTKAFERDMQPVCKAVVEALQAGDKHALEGLRAMLPHLLAEVNASPALADVLTRQLGRELLAGLNGEEADEA